MYNPKPTIYAVLSALGYACMQTSQNVFSEVPAITFDISDNAPDYDLDVNITAQKVIVTVDVWADDSVTTSSIAAEVEAAMREIDYLLTSSLDVPAPEGCLFHYQLRFSGTKTPEKE